MATTASVRASRTLNKTNIVVLTALHLFGAVGVVFLITHPPGWGIIWLAIGFYCYAGLGVALGYHRDYTHSSFKSAPPLRLFWLIGAALALQGTVLNWVKDHRLHHKYADEGGLDPHSPYEYGRREPLPPLARPLSRWQLWRRLRRYEFKHRMPQYDTYLTLGELVRGLWWSHAGWLCYSWKRPADAPKVTDLTRPGSMFTWQAKNYGYFVVATFVVPMLIGGLLGLGQGTAGVVEHALGGLLIAGALRVVVFLHITWCVNSVCHTVGTRAKDMLGRKFYGDDGRNNVVVAAVTFGEGNHGVHHADARAAFHGYRWYHIDQAKWILLALELPERLRLVCERRSLASPSPWRSSQYRRAAQILRHCRLVWDVRRWDKGIVFRDNQVLPEDRSSSEALAA